METAPAVRNEVDLAKSILLENSAQQTDESCYYFPKRHTLSDKNSFHQILHAMNELLLLYRRKHDHRGLAALRFSELLIELSMDYFLWKLHYSSGNGSKAVAKVHALLDYIHRNYTDKIGSAQIEREFESNYDYLNRIFKETTGYTITRYVNKIRIQHAQQPIWALGKSDI